MATTPAGLSIVPRQLMIGFDQCKPNVDWAGDPSTSCFLVAMSAIFPKGERLFIDVLRHYQDRITDPSLKKNVKGFIGQEARHALMHEQMNDWFAQQGYPMKRILGIASFGVGLLRHCLPRWSQMGVTMAIEHITAQFSNFMLHNEEFMSRMDPVMRSMWELHAIEEAEHKSVVHDVFTNLRGGYLMRVSHLLLGCFLFFTVVFAMQLCAMQATGHLSWTELRRGHRIMWGKGPRAHGMGKAMMSNFWGDYFRRDFHPFDLDNLEAMKQMHERLERRGVFQMTSRGERVAPEESDQVLA